MQTDSTFAETASVSRPPRGSGTLARRWWTRVATIDWALAFLFSAAALALYVRTMAPGLLEGDEGEFQINIFKLGVSHTGYPLFFLLGKLWTWLVPAGTIATRANLFSAFWGALTIGAVFALIQFLTRNRWAAALCALLLLASRVEWSQAVIPRPYTMNSLFVVLVVGLFFLWRAGRVDLTVPVFAFGLSLTNHRTIMWLGPAIALFVLWHERGALFRPRRLLSLAVAFLLPFLLYGYVFWRGESDVGVEFHWKDFNDEILGGYVRASWRFGPFGWLVSRVTDLYIPMLVEQFTPLGFIAGLVGAVALALDRPPRGWPRELPAREAFLFILLANLANTAFCVIFWVIDIDKFFLPSFITFLFFTAVGIAVAWEWLAAQPVSRLTRPALILLFCAATGLLVLTNLPLDDWSKRTDVAQAWTENLSQPLEPNAVIAGSWESITPLEYAMYVDGRRRDLERWKLIVNNYQLGQVPYGSRQEDIERAVRAGRPVYLTVYPGETETLGALTDEFLLTRVGELWRVVNAPPVDRARQEELKTAPPQAVFKEEEGLSLELLGHAIGPSSTPAQSPGALRLQAGDFAVVTMYWRMPRAASTRLSISLRLLDAWEHLIVQRDSEPASGRRPTSGWLTNEIVQDDAGLLVPPDAPPGLYHLEMVVYDAATGENLQWPGGTVYALADLNLAPAAYVPSPDVLNIPHPLDKALAPLRVAGYDLSSTTPKGGDTIDLSLWWQLDSQAQPENVAAAGPPADGITLLLRDEAGRSAKLYAGAAIEGYPAAEWVRGQVLRGRYSLTLPLDLAGSTRLVLETAGGAVELAEMQVRPSGRSFALPRIAHPLAATLGDSIQLLGYDVDETSLPPGGKLNLTLYWKALRPPGQGYVVFTHLLDPQGILRGQKDSAPHGGALATDRWLQGEVVEDRYEIALAPDAPTGTYRVEVGMYSPETGARLVLVDAAGVRQPEDRMLLDTPIQVR